MAQLVAEEMGFGMQYDVISLNTTQKLPEQLKALI